MNITDEDGYWMITDHTITNRKTGEVRKYKVPFENPERRTLAHAIGGMSYDTFLRKCAAAFFTGEWPVTRWASGAITY